MGHVRALPEGRHGVGGYSASQLAAIEAKVLDACIVLKGQGLYPGSLRLAAAVPGHHKNTLLDARARLIARGALILDARHGTEDRARPRRHVDPDDHVAIFKAAWKRIMKIPRRPGDTADVRRQIQTPTEQTTVVEDLPPQ